MASVAPTVGPDALPDIDTRMSVVLKAGGCRLSNLLEDSLIGKLELIEKEYHVVVDREEANKEKNTLGIGVTINDNGFVVFDKENDTVAVHRFDTDNDVSSTPIMNNIENKNLGKYVYSKLAGESIPVNVKSKEDYICVFNVVDTAKKPTNQIATIELNSTFNTGSIAGSINPYNNKTSAYFPYGERGTDLKIKTPYKHRVLIYNVRKPKIAKNISARDKILHFGVDSSTSADEIEGGGNASREVSKLPPSPHGEVGGGKTRSNRSNRAKNRLDLRKTYTPGKSGSLKRRIRKLKNTKK